MTKPVTLVFVSVALIASMLVIVPWLTHSVPAPYGYLGVFILYWFGFCLPLGLWFQGPKAALTALSLDCGDNTWVPWAVAIQVAVVAVANWVLLPDAVPVIAISLGLGFGALNGFLEEFFWRGAYLEQGGRQSLPFMVFGALLFGLWHVPLALAHGVTYEGGAIALIGGGFGLGLFWTFVAFRTGRTGWTTIAHILTNFAAFTGLIATNFAP